VSEEVYIMTIMFPLQKEMVARTCCNITLYVHTLPVLLYVAVP